MKLKMNQTNWVRTAVLAAGCAFAMESAVQAIPTLQLDISGGVYRDETVYSQGPKFTLYALLNPNSTDTTEGNKINNVTIGNNFYISLAIEPNSAWKADKTRPTDLNLGSIKIGTTVLSVTKDMAFGVPPIYTLNPDLANNVKDLPSHDMYPTFYYETPAFHFLESQKTTEYNVQDSRFLGANNNGSLYYVPFAIDVSNLNPDYSVHFDLYAYNTIEGTEVVKYQELRDPTKPQDENQRIKVDKQWVDNPNYNPMETKEKTVPITTYKYLGNAPFSHDAQTGHSTPDAGGTLSLLGCALLGIEGLRRKLSLKA